MRKNQVIAPKSPLLPYEFAKTQRVIAFEQDQQAQVISEQPLTKELFQELYRFLTNHFKSYTCTPIEFDQLLTEYYSAGDDDGISNSSLPENFDLQSFANTLAPTEDLLSGANDAPIIKLINGVISQAIKDRASDIHFEPYEENFIIRYRVDGILQQVLTHDSRLSAPIISRLKIIARLDIAERRKPQDGAASFKTDKKEVDLRVSVLPTVNKERVVMRILDKSAGDVTLDELGFEPQDLEKLKKAVSSPQGMVLVTGPTGSGKTTTLYSILKHINKPEMNILTAEDPVEYELDGVGQVQVKESIGFGFEESLRSFLRQDPEVILVGEIRDQATVEIALKASLTGHLVFSTLHTNDAPSSITRLLNMGTPNYLISAALTLIMAQRLARKNCPECAEIDENITPKILNDIGLATALHDRAKIYKGKGCDKCGNSGYKGRMGIYEILLVDRDLKNGILQNLTQTELEGIAKKNGFKTMQQMGHDLLLSGELSYSEYDRVIQSDAK